MGCFILQFLSIYGAWQRVIISLVAKIQGQIQNLEALPISITPGNSFAGIPLW
jgi:hypothetical protein